jgi:hypothetical protein
MEVFSPRSGAESFLGSGQKTEIALIRQSSVLNYVRLSFAQCSIDLHDTVGRQRRVFGMERE